MRDNDLVWLFEVGTKLEIRSEITTPLLGVALCKIVSNNYVKDNTLELVSKELNHLAFVCLCREFDFYEVKKNVIIFQKEKGNPFTLLSIFIVKSLQKEQNSTNLLL